MFVSRLNVKPVQTKAKTKDQLKRSEENATQMTKCLIEIFSKLTIQLNFDTEIRIFYRTISMLLYVVISVWKSITYLDFWKRKEKLHLYHFSTASLLLDRQKSNFSQTDSLLITSFVTHVYVCIANLFTFDSETEKTGSPTGNVLPRNRSSRTGSPKWPNVWSVPDPDRRARRVNSKPAGRTMRAFIHGVWHHGGAWWCMVEGLTHRAPSKRAPALADRDVLFSGISHYRRVYTYVRITDSCILNYVATLLLQ